MKWFGMGGFNKGGSPVTTPEGRSNVEDPGSPLGSVGTISEINEVFLGIAAALKSTLELVDGQNKSINTLQTKISAQGDRIAKLENWVQEREARYPSDPSRRGAEGEVNANAGNHRLPCYKCGQFYAPSYVWDHIKKHCPRDKPAGSPGRRGRRSRR